ncbi:MAG: M6 family metalloprotease domain-containing protein [Bacteroidota bacterium]
MSKVRFCLLASLLSFWSLTLEGAWLNNVPQTVKQPDGSVLHCLATGDEYYNWLHDTEGYTIIQDPVSGFFVYAIQSGSLLAATQLIPGKDNPASFGIPSGLRPDPANAYAKRERREAINTLKSANSTTNTGTINNIVVFIRFSDQAEYTQPVSVYSSAFNATGTVSMFEYFKEVSASQLAINTSLFSQSGTSVVSFQDTLPRSYYMKYDATTNPNGYKNDEESTYREMTLLKYATESLKSQIESTGLDYDHDANGKIDNVTYIVQGSAEGWSDLLWPHMWALYKYNVEISGVRVWNFNFQLSESFGVSVLCHEMFHSLGAPDLYRYSNKDITPVGPWDLMASNSTPPQHMNAWMKMKYGKWCDDLPVITEAGSYSLSPLSASPCAAYRINSPLASGEFFVVEYRKQAGRFETALPSSGLIIYRVASSLNGNANGPPDEVYVYRKGGNAAINGQINQAAFSAETGMTAFGPGTDPACFLSNGTSGGIIVENISSAANSITFSVRFAAQTQFNPPQNLSVTSNTNSATLSWDYPEAGVPILTGYRIYRNNQQIYSGSEPSLKQFVDTNLQPGTYSYFISALYNSPIGESDRSNAVSVTIINPLPDLVVESPLVQPNPVFSGQIVLIQCRVVNRGTLESQATSLKVLLSRDGTGDASDQTLFQTDLPSLAKQQIYPVSQNYTLPLEISDGEWFILFITDPDGLVNESSEANNLSTVSLIIRKSYPDAEPAGMTAQGFYFAGSSSNISITIINNGPGILEPANNRLFISQEEYWNASSSLLNTFMSPQLASGESYLKVIPVDIPADIQPGNYYLVLEADFPDALEEGDELNNIFAQPILISTPLPDFTVRGISIHPDRIGQGKLLTIDFQIENDGQVPAGSTSILLVASADTVYTNTDVILSTVTVPSLSSGEVYPCNTVVRIPEEITPGQYYLLIIADPESTIAETSEVNNLIYRIFEIFNTSGTNNLFSLDRISIYPNPVTDRLYVDLKGLATGLTSYKIISLTGMVYSEELRVNPTEMLQIETTGLKPGRYILILNTPDQSQAVSFIKGSM